MAEVSPQLFSPQPAFGAYLPPAPQPPKLCPLPEPSSCSALSTVSDSASDDYIKAEPSAKAARLLDPPAFSWEATSPLAFSKGWSAQDSAELYNLSGWGAPYFAVNAAGNLAVNASTEDGPALDLYHLVQSLHEEGLRTPVLLRFLDIVGNRISRLNAAFNNAINRFEYQGAYNGVFPVKCNHDKDLVRSVVEYGQPYNFGLEVGSKAELIMVMSILASHPGANLVCNGYKDHEYMELVLHCRELGINAMVVMEQYSELDMLLDVSKRLGVRPAIGIRAKLATRHNGHWGSTSGDKAKFGLRAREIVAAVNQLADEGMLDCLQLLHFHVGSQITNIRMVKEVMREATYLYAELVKMGAAMRYIDVGGGLAVDYDGSFTDSVASMSYTLQNYANDVVSAMQEVCIQRGIEAPTIMSESGRALASHHSVLVFDVLTKPEYLREVEKREEEEEVLDTIEIREDHTLTKQLRAAARHGRGHFLLMTFKEVFDNISAEASALREAYSDATYFKDEALRAFKLGVLSLEERAQIEAMFDATCVRLREVAAEHDLPLPDALRPSSNPSTRTYHVNMSVFRSAVDSWAIQQLFPVMPIHRLHEEPTVHATLADLTCDSDGKICAFPNPKGGEPLSSLPLHEVRVGDRYYLGLFLTGVYQEVMGSVHNMFGSVNTVVVRAGRPQQQRRSITGSFSSCMSLDEKGPSVAAASAPTPAPTAVAAGLEGYIVERVLRGETVAEVLSRAHHHAPEMLASVTEAVEGAVLAGSLERAAAERLLDTFNTRLAGYTYMASP